MSQFTTTDPGRLLRLTEVKARTGQSETGIRRLMAAGEFPKPVHIGPRSVAWPESEVAAWIAHRIAERDGGAAA